MKKTTKNSAFINLSLLVITITFFASCSKDNILATKENPSLISIEREILNFKSFDTFKALTQKEVMEFNEFEQKEDFTSLRELYRKALKSQDEFVTSLKKQNLTLSILPYPDLVNSSKQSFYFYSDSPNSFYMNISNEKYSPWVNKYGLVRIGDYLVQFLKDETKTLYIGKGTLKTGDLNKIMNAHKSNFEEKLEVKKNSISRLRLSENSTCENISGDDKVNGRLGIIVNWSPKYEYDPVTDNNIYLGMFPFTTVTMQVEGCYNFLGSGVYLPSSPVVLTASFDYGSSYISYSSGWINSSSYSATIVDQEGYNNVANATFQFRMQSANCIISFSN
ncbi:hypothetical protein [Runella sp.]|uniref:hypothetical protein n=1 Tax=Runella sp. TaxID=1960881 RepID=UPI003D13349F